MATRFDGNGLSFLFWQKQKGKVIKSALETGGDCGDGQQKPATEMGSSSGNWRKRRVAAKFDGDRRKRGNLLLATVRYDVG